MSKNTKPEQPKPLEPSPPPPEPLVVRLTREAFSPYVTLHLPDASTEDLEPDEAKAWFQERGAKGDGVDKALDHVWNFYGFRRPVIIRINNPVTPKPARPSITPSI